MEWTYIIKAKARPRLLTRIAQVFDQQSVTMGYFRMEQNGDLMEIAITVGVDDELAERLLAKLYKLVDLVSIEMTAGQLLEIQVPQALRK